MTSGSKTYDSTTAVSTSAGPGRIGQKLVKIWNGGDRPSTDPHSGVLPQRPVFWVDSNGASHQIHTSWGRYRPPARPPSRVSKDQGEHSYSSTIDRSFDNLLRWNNGTGASGTGTFQNTVGGMGSFPSVPWTSNDTNSLIGKLREKVAGSDFNAGVFLGEGREALSMIATNATKIFTALTRLRRGNFVGATEALTGVRRRGRTFRNDKDIASQWLELQYGWLPLLADVKGGAEFLAHNLNFPLQQVVRVRMRVEKTKPTWATSSPSTSKMGNVQINSYGQIKAILKEKDVAQLSGLLDPLSVAWELVPYSFVIDWFLPIGDWLQNRGLASALTGTFVTSRIDRLNCSNLIGQGGWTFTGSTYSQERIITSRSVSSSLDVPFPTVKGLEEAVSWKRAANAVALLTQLRRDI